MSRTTTPSSVASFSTIQSRLRAATILFHRCLSRTRKTQSKPEFDNLDSDGSASGEGHPVVKIMVDNVRPCLRPFGVPPGSIVVEQFDAQVPSSTVELIELCPMPIASMSITELDEKPDPTARQILSLNRLATAVRLARKLQCIDNK